MSERGWGVKIGGKKEREREKFVCDNECVYLKERERERERNRMCVYLKERERERERNRMCVYKRDGVSVCELV